MNKLKALHEKHRVEKRFRKQFHLNHQYDRKLKTWRFVGYKCIYCDRMVRADKTLEQHSRRCHRRGLTVIADRLDRAEVIVLKKDRTVWSPLETNHKFSE